MGGMYHTSRVVLSVSKNEEVAMEKRELSTLGEFGLIKHLTQHFPIRRAETVLGVGDDCAILRAPEGERVVVTTDALLEGVHFDLTYFPLRHLGYKAVSVNVSDVCAMNASPAQLLVTVGVSKRFYVEDLEELYEGIRLACEHYHVDLVGGDTTSSLTGLTLSLTAIGYGAEEKLCRRSGAEAHELIFVTGNLGASYLGLQLLEREKRVMRANPHGAPDFAGYEYPLERMLKPEARLDAVEAFRKAGVVPTSMIDISDGLSSELLHICEASNVGCRVFPERIPIDQTTMRLAEEMHISPLVAALNGGEDYELLFTVPRALMDAVSDLGATMIGYTVPEDRGRILVTAQGEEFPIKAQGWDAYSREGENRSEGSNG